MVVLKEHEKTATECCPHSPKMVQLEVALVQTTVRMAAAAVAVGTASVVGSLGDEKEGAGIC